MINQELIYLLRKLKSGQLNSDERDCLRKIFQNIENKKFLVDYFNSSFEDIISKIDTLPENEEKESIKTKLLIEITEQNSIPLLNFKKNKRNLNWTGVAVALFISIGIYVLTTRILNKNIKSTEWIVVQTKNGERKKITLYDETTITLNGNTKLTYTSSLQGDYRLVKLQGEAFFNVTPDRNKPFIVVTEDFSTLVKGTSFNIDSDISKVVEVSTGVVQVFSIKESNALNCIQHQTADIASQLSKETIHTSKNISAGQTASIGAKMNSEKNMTENIETEKNNAFITLVNKGQRVKLNPNRNLTLSDFEGQIWTKNELVYLNEPLSQVATKIYRNYGDSVIIEPELKNKNITISFRNKNKEEVLKTITEICNAKLNKDQTNKNWIITTN